MNNDQVVNDFLENHNMTYLFLLLANLEVDRISNLPYTVRKKINGKITSAALEHIALNEIPDYIIEELFEDEEVETI